MRGVEATYRLCAIRIACSFRTISDEAALVIAGQVPLRELIRERKEIHDAMTDSAAEARSKAEIKDAARRTSIDRWQTRWDHSPKGRWTHTLIPSIACWVERKHGQVDFYLTQALSGHGCFRGYLKRFGHETEDWCPECGTGIEEDARHVLFDCHRFDLERQTLETVAGSRVSTETLVPLMLADPKVWDAAAEFASSVMRTLRSLERRRKEQTE
ncbi:uncharacterized protein LOC6587761 isoform X1 [Drosophila persimilis]|uniref:uncharacterized protein LOC6587761 isoform X1 n=1 Tax=Drosophila persimilis TaxID=7234 RepID=UPI000F07C802|nr:uncharacterized protein LOC6587761 isoform X1 [Drosophila persimilis]